MEDPSTNDSSNDYDKYSNSRIAPSNADENETDKRDETTKKRENFLSIYKESNTGKDGDGDREPDAPDLSNGIRFKRDANEDEPDFELKTGGATAAATSGRPLI